MKISIVITTPEVRVQPLLALLSGTFHEKLAKVARLGYDGVELMVVDPAQLDVQAVRAAVDGAGLEVPAIGTGALFLNEKLSLLAPDEKISRRALARAKAIIDFAAEWGALVTIGGFRGRLEWTGDPTGAHQCAIALMRKCADWAAGRGVRLVLEPLNRYESDLVHNVEEALEFIAEVDRPNFGLLVDTFHMNIEEASITGGLRRAAPVLWHIHVGDSNRLPPGCGHLDFAEIVGTLRAIGYQGYLSAELLAKPDRDAAAQATIEHLRRLLPNQRGQVLGERTL
jgi:sugar phosphate isomerase/epimerase